MKRLLSFAAAIAFLCCLMPAPQAHAQYLGTAAQQTVAESFPKLLRHLLPTPRCKISGRLPTPSFFPAIRQ